MDIFRMKRPEGKSFYNWPDVDMDSLEFAKSDIDLFTFHSRKGYEEFILPDGVERVKHIMYGCSLDKHPDDKTFAQKLFSHCVQYEVDKSTLFDPVLIIRSNPEITDNIYDDGKEILFRSRFSLVERSWLQYAVIPFVLETHEDGCW